MRGANSLAATVIIPTAIDRGPTLTLAVESVLRQSIQDLEVFIIGDGAAEVTRQTARRLEQADARIRFFDHPKHVRRGEPYRHAALQEARGRIVCYLVDRDLFLPDHVEEMSRLLEGADMAHSFLCKVGQRGYDLPSSLDLTNPEDRQFLAVRRTGLPLAFGAHTLAAYHRLAEGWATTPGEYYTDGYFWSKFARDPAMRCASGWRPTVLNFSREGHPGWSTGQRFAELQIWSDRIQMPGEVEAIHHEILRAALGDRAARCRFMRRGPLRIAWTGFKVYLGRKLKHPLALPLRWLHRLRKRK